MKKRLGLWLLSPMILQSLTFYLASWHCRLHGDRKAVDAVVLSDVHLLGHRRRSVLERVWSDWQIMVSVMVLGHVHRPKLLIVVGDQLDEGGFPTQQLVFERYVRRFFRAFSHARVKTLFVMGNHDVSLKFHEELIRYENAFGASNSVLHVNGASFVVLNTIALDNDISSGNIAKIQAQSFLADLSRNLTKRDQKVILLTHFPLYRVNDLDCGDFRRNEGGHVTYLYPSSPYRVHEHVLSENLSTYLLETLRPSLVLSGHTHAYCALHHPIRSENASNMRIPEHTIPTFAWSQRPDPSYAVLRLNSTALSNIQLCHLPDERLIGAMYLLLIPILLLILQASSPLKNQKAHRDFDQVRTTQSLHKESESEVRLEGGSTFVNSFVVHL